MKNILRYLLFAVIGTIGAANCALAQTDTSYFVGAIAKTGIAAIGPAPVASVIAASGATQTLVFPAYGSAVYDVTLTANCTFTITAPTTASGPAQSITLIVRNPTGGFTTTISNTVKWNNSASAPTFITTAGVAMQWTFTTDDNGVTYFAK